MNGQMKRSLAAVLAAALLLALIPANVLAATKYQLWVGGTEVTSSRTKGDGWSYQASSNTLTLDNYKYSGKGRTEKYSNGVMDYAAICYDGDKTLKLVLKGKNRLDIVDAKDEAAEIDVILCRSDLEISGDGSLEVKAGACSYYSIGIWCAKNITFSSGTITAVGGKSRASYGVSCTGNLTVSGGKLTAKGAAAEEYSLGIWNWGEGKKFTLKDGEVRLIGSKAGRNSYGLQVFDMSIEGGTLNAQGGEAGDFSLGIYSSNNMTISGGTVSAKAAVSRSVSYGLFSDKDLTILGGTVYASGASLDGTEYDKLMSMGIYAREDLTIKGGDVTAESGDVSADSAPTWSLGMEAWEGNVQISGGKVTATAGKAFGPDGSSQGITSGKKVIISGGDVTAVSSEAKTDSYGVWSEDTMEIKKGVASLTLSGLEGAIYGEVLTEVRGTGWTDADGTEGKATIAASDEPQTLDYRMVQFPLKITFSN